MNITENIRNFDYLHTTVSDALLKDALDLYEAALDTIVKNPPRDENQEIPGMAKFNLASEIVDRYYKQNPGFAYQSIREGFTSEQLKTLENIQGDKEVRERIEQRQRLRGYR